MKNYTFLTRREYFEALPRLIDATAASERVMLATMSIDVRDPLIAQIVTSLTAAAQRGVHATLNIDTINFFLGRGKVPVPRLYRRSFEGLRGASLQTFLALQTFQAAGGTYCITNMPRHRFGTPVMGRSHIKGAVIGDRVFVGGCNLEKARQIDVMTSWVDAAAAHTLANWLGKIAETGQTREAFGDVDSLAALDSTTNLLLDAGVPRQSLIYDEALQLIDEAEEWLYITCQYFPGGPTAKHLAAAEARGVKVSINYSHPSSHGPDAALQHLHLLRQRTRGLPRGFFANQLERSTPKLHAKVLASEKAAMVGSHNYVIQGVNFGTAELALQSHDPSFSDALCTFIEQQLGTFRQPTPAREQQTTA